MMGGICGRAGAVCAGALRGLGPAADSGGIAGRESSFFVGHFPDRVHGRGELSTFTRRYGGDLGLSGLWRSSRFAARLCWERRGDCDRTAFQSVCKWRGTAARRLSNFEEMDVVDSCRRTTVESADQTLAWMRWAWRLAAFAVFSRRIVRSRRCASDGSRGSAAAVHTGLPQGRNRFGSGRLRRIHLDAQRLLRTIRREKTANAR